MRAPPSLVPLVFPTASIPLGYAEGEASIIIKRLQATTDSLRSVRRESDMSECGNTFGYTGTR
jgi:hypothetical protein